MNIFLLKKDILFINTELQNSLLYLYIYLLVYIIMFK